jgi:tetratricopeptide (TPR) repeat protein
MGPDKVEKLLLRAQQAIAERDWEKAKQVYLLALGLRSDLVDVHYGLATVYFQLRELTSAAHHFREVTRLDPQRSGAYINLGAVLNLLEQFDDAVTALRKGIQLDSKRVEAFYNLGLVYKRKGQADLAITAYREAIRLNPRMADAHLNLANLYMEREQPRLALQHYEQAAKIRPGWEKADEGVAQAKAAMEGAAVPAAANPGSSATHRAVSVDLDRVVDPVQHANFLTSLHQATILFEETGRLVQKIVGEEIEPVIKELSSALLHKGGSRGELEACISKFEGALARMKTAHQAMKAQAGRIEEIGERFPTH